MKNTYIVKFRHGLAGRAMVTASDIDGAKREAVSYARFTTACIPDWYRTDDIVESVEPAGDVPLGEWGYGYRPVVQLETHEDFKRMTAKDAPAPDPEPVKIPVPASDLSEFDCGPAAETAV